MTNFSMSNIITSRTSTQFDRYGMTWDRKVWSPLDVELYCYLKDTRNECEGGRLTRWDHYRNAVDLCWNTNPNSNRKVIWNDWSEEMARAMIYNTYVSLAGCASSGKSDCLAVYGLISYLAAPQETKVILSSTSLAGARLRVWKSVSELWCKGLPGKMVPSRGMIKGYNGDGEICDETGLQLIAPSGSADQDLDVNFIGIKQKRLIVLLDELTDLPLGVLNSCLTNLEGGKQLSFDLKAASNPNLYTDAFGVLSKPKAGWNSVTTDDRRWETERGICIRFDSEKSPNMILGENKYPWLPDPESIAAAKHDFGEESRFFYRMYKAMWFADSADETIYSEGELIKSRCDQPISDDEYKGRDPQRVACAGADPAYTQGGDRFPIIYGDVVQLNGISVLEVKGMNIIKDDVTTENSSRSYDAVKYMSEFCVNRNISPERFGYDMTGAGIPFRDIVVAQWSSLPMGVNFGGHASKLQISPVDKRKGSEVYYNRVSEIWARMKGLIREGRVRGLPPELIKEICERKWHKNMLTGGKLRIESKVDMKKRGMPSPDVADAFFVLCEVIIRLGLMGEMEEIEIDKRSKDGWADLVAMHDMIALSDQSLTFD